MAQDLMERLTKIAEEINAHQIAVFGRTLTSEERAQSEIERQDESIKKYAGMTTEEFVKTKKEEMEIWRKEMVERYGPEILNIEYDDDEEDEYEDTVVS